MNIFEFLKFAPKGTLFLLPLALALLAFIIFSLFKKQKEESPPAVSPSVLAETPPPSPRKGVPENLFLILTILLLILSLPVAVFLVKQGKEIRMRAEEDKELTPTPTFPSEEPTSTPAAPLPQCERITIYDQDWVEIPFNRLSSLAPGQVVKIAVRGEREGNFDRGRIRINSMEWTPENETSDQKPGSPGEFYIECGVEVIDEKATICGISATLEDEFKIEAETHDAVKDEWR